jgi:hypothetical protein
MRAAPTTQHFAWIFWGMAAFGVAIELALAFAYVGQPYDQQSFAMVREALSAAPFDVYDRIAEGHWNYPPGYFLWIWPAGGIADATGLAFHGVVQLPAIAANVAIAWIVQRHLASRGLEAAPRLAAAGLVLLGPVFVAISGYHGQIDSVAILPAVLAFVLWDRGGAGRAVAVGLLIGAAIALKTAPGLLLLALLPSARSAREAVALIGWAAAIPLAMLAPYVITDAGRSLSAIEYPSVGTAGGLGLLSTTLPNPIVDGIRDLGTIWNGLWIAALGLLLWRLRPPPVRAAVIVWLALFVFGTGFYLHYLVWGLPFLLLDGALLAAAAIQALALAPLIVSYGSLFGGFVANRAFDVPMLALWLLCAWLLGERVARAIRAGGSTPASRAAARPSPL